MAYNQITASGGISPGPDPTGPNRKEIRDIIFNCLNQDDYIFNWTQQSSQPYTGTLDTGSNTINLFIYAWRIGNGGRTNLPSEKRIQIQQNVNNVGFTTPITTTQKTLLIGIYDSPSGTPIFAAWDATANSSHTQKSCQVQVEDLQAALIENIHQCTDSKNNIIYTFTPDTLGDYIDLVQPGNALAIPTSITTGKLHSRIKKATMPSRKNRTIKSTNDILNKIRNLSQSEKEAVCKQRVGQGLFKELLKTKYGCKCALCNISTENMLIGSHIKAWSVSTDIEKLDENNGLLLCSHHDALFDKHLISFDDKGKLLISSTLSATEQTNLRIDSIPSISLSTNMENYMKEHRAKLKK